MRFCCALQFVAFCFPLGEFSQLIGVDVNLGLSGLRVDEDLRNELKEFLLFISDFLSGVTFTFFSVIEEFFLEGFLLRLNVLN